MTELNPTIVTISYALQALGFLGIAYAWYRALQELRRGTALYPTRLLLFVITTVTLSAYVVPTLIALCYFTEGCFQPYYRDYLRLFSGLILFLYGTFKFLLYYTKDGDYDPKRKEVHENNRTKRRARRG